MIKTFFIALLFFFIIDVFWIYFVATPMYKQEVGSLMELKVPPALIFYVVFLLGLIFFVINPNQSNTLFNVFLIGAFFGLVTYGTYDLTIYASMNIFSLKLVIADILWGMFLSGAVAALTVFTINRINSVSYTHLRAHETKANLVCRLLLEKKKKQKTKCNIT